MPTNLRALLAFGGLLVACAADGTKNPPELANETPARVGAAGEAGPPGPPGESGTKGEPGLLNVAEVLGSKAGALPVDATFATTGGRILLSVSGTAYRATAGPIGLDVSLDGAVIGSLKTFTNEPASHKAFPARTFVVQGIAAGNHAISIAPQLDTLSDTNDYFNATLVEVR